MDTCLSASLFSSGSGKQSQAAGQLPWAPHKPGTSPGRTKVPPATGSHEPRPSPSFSHRASPSALRSRWAAGRSAGAREPAASPSLQLPGAPRREEEGREGRVKARAASGQHRAWSWYWRREGMLPRQMATPNYKSCPLAGKQGSPGEEVHGTERCWEWRGERCGWRSPSPTWPDAGSCSPCPTLRHPPPTWGYSCCLGRGQPLPLTFGDPNKRKASGSDFKLEVKMESS